MQHEMETRNAHTIAQILCQWDCRCCRTSLSRWRRRELAHTHPGTAADKALERGQGEIMFCLRVNKDPPCISCVCLSLMMATRLSRPSSRLSPCRPPSGNIYLLMTTLRLRNVALILGFALNKMCSRCKASEPNDEHTEA